MGYRHNRDGQTRATCITHTLTPAVTGVPTLVLECGQNPWDKAFIEFHSNGDVYLHGSPVVLTRETAKDFFEWALEKLDQE